MPDILIRRLDDQTLKRLKSRARRNGRSLESEARLLLRQAAGGGSEEIAAMLDQWKECFAGRRFSGSAALIRKDRHR